MQENEKHTKTIPTKTIKQLTLDLGNKCNSSWHLEKARVRFDPARCQTRRLLKTWFKNNFIYNYFIFIPIFSFILLEYLFNWFFIATQSQSAFALPFRFLLSEEHRIEIWIYQFISNISPITHSRYFVIQNPQIYQINNK